MTIERSGREIECGDADGAIRGYYAAPPSGCGPGALVLGDRASSRELLRDVCDQLARAGFAALAPDPVDIDGDAQLEGAVDAILSCDAVAGARVAAVGFGEVGARATRLATRSARIGAVARFPAGECNVDADDTATDVPILRFVASGASEVAAEDEPSPPIGARAAIRVLPGVRTDYMDAGRADVHDAAAASESWAALVAFLRAELR